MSSAKSIESGRWVTASSDGTRYVVVEYTHDPGFANVKDAVRQPTRGAKEYFLDTGEHVNPLPDGTFEIVMTGQRLTVLG